MLHEVSRLQWSFKTSLLSGILSNFSKSELIEIVSFLQLLHLPALHPIFDLLYFYTVFEIWLIASKMIES